MFTTVLQFKALNMYVYNLLHTYLMGLFWKLMIWNLEILGFSSSTENKMMYILNIHICPNFQLFDF